MTDRQRAEQAEALLAQTTELANRILQHYMMRPAFDTSDVDAVNVRLQTAVNALRRIDENDRTGSLDVPRLARETLRLLEQLDD